MNQNPDFLNLPNTSAESLGFRIPARSSSLHSRSRSHTGYFPKRSRTGRRIRHASLDTIASLDATRDQVTKCLRNLSLSNRASGEIEVGTRRAYGRKFEIQRGTEGSETSSDDMFGSNTDAGDGDSIDADPVPRTRSFGRTNTDLVPQARPFGRTDTNPVPHTRSFGRPWRPSDQRDQRWQPVTQPQPPIERALSKGKKAGHNIKAFWTAARVGNKDLADFRNHPSNRGRDHGETLTDSRPESPAFAWHLLEPRYDAESRSIKSGSLSQSGGQSFSQQSQSYHSHGGSSQSQSHIRPQIPPIPDDFPVRSTSLFPIPTPSTTTGSRSPRSFTIQTPSDPLHTTLTSSTSPPTSPKSFNILRFPEPPTHDGTNSGDRLYILESTTPSDEERSGDDDAYLRLNVIHEEAGASTSDDSWEEINDNDDNDDTHDDDKNMGKNKGKRKQKKERHAVVLERAVQSAMSNRSTIREADEEANKSSRPSRSTTPNSHIRSQISPVLRPVGSSNSSNSNSAKRTPSVRRERYSPVLAAIDSEPPPARVRSRTQSENQTQNKSKRRPEGKVFRVPEAMGEKLMGGYEGMGWE